MIEFGTMYKQRDIIIIPIPFSDLKSTKKRPVVIVSNDIYNKKTEDIIVVAMTSNIEGKKDYSLLISNDDLEVGELKHKSMVRIDKIYTLNKSIVIKKFGTLKREVFCQIEKILQQLFTQ